MPPSEQARKYLEKANELAHRQQFNAAFAQFELAIRRQYGYSKAHADFGSALLEAGKYPEAIEQFRKAIEFNPAERLVVHELTTAFSRDNRQEQDLAEFQKTVDKADRADLYHTWAQVLSDLQRGDHAIEEFKKALRKNPELQLATARAVNAFNYSKNIEQQITAFDETVDKLKHPHAWNSWGQILIHLRRLPSAAKQFEAAVNAKNDWTAPYMYWGGALIELTDYEQAIELQKKALAIDQTYLDAYETLAMALDRMGEPEQAVSYYEKGATAATALNVNYFYSWLVSLQKLSNPHPGIAAYQLALEKSNLVSEPFTWSPYSAFGTFLKEVGRLPESAVQFGKSLALEYDWSLEQLQEALSDLDDRNPTLDHLQQQFDKTDNPVRLAQWARVLAGINETDRARQQLPKLMAFLPHDHNLIGSIGEVVLKLGSVDRRAAQAHIDRAIKQTGDADLEIRWARFVDKSLNEHQQALASYTNLLLKTPKAPGLVDDFVNALQASPSLINEIDGSVRNQKNADVCYHWARILIGLDRSKSAIDHLKRAIELDDSHVDAHYELGRSYNQRGAYTKACREFEKTVELDQNRPAAIQEWGTTLDKNGRREEALEKYAQAIRTRADLARTPFNPPTPAFVTPVRPSLGGDLMAIVDKLTWNDELIARFQKIFDEINFDESYREWGIALTRIKQPDHAIEQFKKAVDLNPDSLENYFEWLKTIGTSGLTPQRLNDYEQAITKYRNNAAAFGELADFLYRLKRNDEAAQRFRRAIELDPKDGRARAGLIYCLLAVNDLDAARQQARELLLHDPANDAVYNCLSWCALIDGDYDEAIKQCELGVEYGHFYLYDTWARALYKSGSGEDVAREKAQQAIDAQPDRVEPLYNCGALLMEMFRYDDAIPLFEKVVQINPDHAFANHNLAAIPFDKGRYEDAYEKWLRAIEVYKKQGSFITRAVEQNKFVDSFEAYYHASLLIAIQHNHRDAEEVLKAGLDFDPNNTMILRSLADLYWELKQELVGVDSDTNRKKSESHWRGMEYFQRAEKMLKERSKRYANYYVLIELGDLYLLNEDFEKARPCFEQARAKDDTAYVPYAKLGVIYLRERQPEKAIPLLQEALKRNPDELDVKSSLAEAYLRAEKFDDAETTYRQVLAVAPNHVQSLIGLGELCSALGDKKDYDRYSEAIDYFARALDIASNEKIRSKYLKKSEEAAVYYQLGYARVQSYESAGLRKDTKLLEQARRDFERCTERNPSHQKARRAKEKIDKRLEYFSRDWLSQTAGPIGILVMSVVVFVFVQAAFFFLPLFNQPSVIVSDRTMQAVKKQVQDAPVDSLNQIKNQPFENHKALSNSLQSLLPADGGKLAEAVMQHAEQVKRFENVPDVPAGYYALLTFGSLLFMVVGLYLPQILKLRVAGIELEKSSIDQAGAGGTLGISKL